MQQSATAAGGGGVQQPSSACRCCLSLYICRRLIGLSLIAGTWWQGAASGGVFLYCFILFLYCFIPFLCYYVLSCTVCAEDDN